ncbi:MAG TPA: hypothetical protein VFO26_16195 [Gaiella sp.]|uniref:hypothetical protein n=1 Tax=Gaiella sp. TaxID=2663207 RepID=UPI002D805777|nr:hypothetical protein [Gaiella sp.]HET9289095.1 hypothetical protein [Gaiella sp.]
MRSKRQMTMAKMMREQAVRDRRARKQEKKEARRQAATPGEPDAVTPEETTPTADGQEPGSPPSS